MQGHDTMEAVSTEITSIWRRNDIEESTWKTHRHFIDFESGIHVEISTSNRWHNFHVDSPFKIDIISTNFPRGISTWSWWLLDEDVSIGYLLSYLLTCWFKGGPTLDNENDTIRRCLNLQEFKTLDQRCSSFFYHRRSSSLIWKSFEFKAEVYLT